MVTTADPGQMVALRLRLIQPVRAEQAVLEEAMVDAQVQVAVAPQSMAAQVADQAVHQIVELMVDRLFTADPAGVVEVALMLVISKEQAEVEVQSIVTKRSIQAMEELAELRVAAQVEPEPPGLELVKPAAEAGVVEEILVQQEELEEQVALQEAGAAAEAEVHRLVVLEELAEEGK